MALFRYASKLKKADEHDYLYKWDFKKSLVDEVRGVTANLAGDAIFLLGEGVKIETPTSYILSPTGIERKGHTVEIDFGNMVFKGGTSHGRLFMWSSDCGFIFRNGKKWEVYNSNQRGWDSNTVTFSDENDGSAFSNSTLKVVMGIDQRYKYYRNNDLVYEGKYDVIGGSGFRICSDSASFYDVTISGVRIYENED